MEKELSGWLGGDFDDLGFYKTKEDAERGMFPDVTIDTLLTEYKGKLVKVKIEVLEE